MFPQSVPAGGGGPLFRRWLFSVRLFAPPGLSVCACIRPHQSSPLELLTHNLLLAPGGICCLLSLLAKVQALKLS